MDFFFSDISKNCRWLEPRSREGHVTQDEYYCDLPRRVLPYVQPTDELYMHLRHSRICNEVRKQFLRTHNLVQLVMHEEPNHVPRDITAASRPTPICLTAMPRLPSELYSAIIDYIVPSDNVIAYPASDPTTKALLSCLTASSLTYPAACRNLYAHCLYIDSPSRLDRIVRSLEIPNRPTTTNRGSVRPKVQYVRGLYLACFTSDTIKDPVIVNQIGKLFGLVHTRLAKLVINLPLRSHYPEDDVDLGLRRTLRRAFLQLSNLEEFTSVQDELYLDSEIEGAQSIVWTTWPRLQRLALYNPQIDDPDFQIALRKSEKLTTLVVTRSDGLEEGTEDLRRILSPSSTVLLVDAALSGHGLPFVGREPDDQAARVIDVRVIGNSERVNAIHLCQDWICHEALQGKLWSWSRYDQQYVLSGNTSL